MNIKEKTYRVFEVDGVTYSGKDGKKGRTCDYIFDLFPERYFEGKTVLDIGCAAGAVLFEANKRGIKEGTGVDVDWDKTVSYTHLTLPTN